MTQLLTDPSLRSITSVWFDQPAITREDVVKVALLCLVLHYFRVFAKRTLFTPFAAYFGISRQQGVDKFAESMWYFLYYTFTLSLAFTIFQDRKWFFLKHEHYFTDFPDYNEPVQYQAIRWFFLLQFCFYLQCAVAIIIWDTRRKDLWQMVLHHAITVSGLAFAFMAGEHRVAVTGLVIHDMADGFLSFGKVVNCIDTHGTPKRRWTFHVKNVAFGLFATIWVVTRNILYPLLVIWPSILHAPAEAPFYKYLPTHAYFTCNSKVMCAGSHCIDPHMLCTGFMCILEVLHVFWLYLIVKMIMRSFGGVKGDIRSDDEEVEHVDLTASDTAEEATTRLDKCGLIHSQKG